MNTITFGSVCSGIEAASVAWNPLGWRAAWLAEIEPFPCAVLAHHYPDVPNLGDMTKIATMVRDYIVPAPDVFCGGTPCQAFSIAGLRNSLDDARGNLSLIFCEIANEIDIRRAADGLLPAVIFWENVPGVLSTKDNAFGCFLAGLAGEDDPLVPAGDKWTNAGCVFGPKRTVAWRVLDAQYFGVAQRRRRVFVVASARKGFDPVAVLFEQDSVRRDSAPRRETGQDAAGATSSGATFSCGGIGKYSSSSSSSSLMASGADLGPGCEMLIAGDVICMAHGQGGAEVARERSPTLTCNHEAPIAAYSVALRGREGGATAELGGDVATCLRASTGGGDKPHVLAPTTFSIQAGALRTNPNSGPDGVGVQADIAYTLEARAEVQAVAAMAFQERGREGGRSLEINGDLAYALTAPSGGGRAQERNVMTPGMAVRRLTPIECARLQGFPDNYLSQVSVRGKLAADGPMYKALGNSWAVPNVAWIGRRIAAALSISDMKEVA